MIHVPATVHGRVLLESDEATASPAGALVGFHGYAQTSADMMAELRRIPLPSECSSAWARVSIQALHPFYLRGESRVGASWMTRDDRDLAIADNIAYVDAALDRALGTQHEARSTQPPKLVFLGFSQGAAMAYRAALFGARPAAAVIAVAGDIPPELKTSVQPRQPWPRILIAVGDKEAWYSPARIAEDLAFLESKGIAHALVRFDGGHEWTDEVRAAAGRFVQEVL